MDSLFDILIIFVILFSIINSIFGKKKAQQKKKQEGAQPVAHEKKRDSIDMLEQIFGIPSQPKKPEYEKDTGDYRTWDPEAEFGATKTKTSIPKSIENQFGVKPKFSSEVNYDKMKSLESIPLRKQKLSLIEKDLEKIKRVNKKQIALIKKLRDPKTLRDYVLVSEILNKPKALSD